jgi:hypothetical protein
MSTRGAAVYLLHHWYLLGFFFAPIDTKTKVLAGAFVFLLQKTC